MIQIRTIGSERIITAPRALMDVALGVFPGEDQRSAIFRLARELTANDLHTTENIAINVGHGDALDFARKRLVIRKSALG